MGNGAEVQWTLRGIELCINHFHAVRQEEKAKALIRRPHVARWLADDMYAVICQALVELKRCDKSKALKLLQKAKDRARNVTYEPVDI